MADVADAPWLTILGWGESGINGLTPASKAALERAEIVFGAARHLRVLPSLQAEVREWPVPFADGVPELLAERGRQVVMLVSGDPFWFGAGTVLARHLSAGEWLSHPSPSTFSLAAARLGWGLERTRCLGLHAAPLTRIRPALQSGQRLIVLLRDGDAVAELSALLTRCGFSASTLHILEALGGERERVRSITTDQMLPVDIEHPVAVGLEVDGNGPAMPLAPGLPDEFFEHDGQITKQRVRAMTLAALAPKAGERLWDIGSGSGSIAIEWLLTHAENSAIGFERSSERAARARRNASALGVDWLEIIEGAVPEALEGQPLPDAVFIGGGLTAELLDTLWDRLPKGVRIVANAVTLESEALLAQWHVLKGGDLGRIELADARPIGRRRGWKASYPIVQWRITR
ncbi:bifunctional cobalt-precorrin-7 (C(5))-methyltransferase/cobalt-precorrin-6B (C(15))-methyltransferase [Marinobacter nanhaiticus D15-8W]|uniref:Bifunctional cobalt-precorrin-7 (C(5))-methyltransferase/cobalt-precorrin-6B (C(15))-methyltransferase n=1 Tax=Marinobacter nanhaiticus D15-8W TaxID=626887 RepID=N6W234_9GAMM|nr:bifunctional cobalt-precorrin-7 (C(5))-methyltransferase/cobalt-precorrin-6B (C(15))-methyltransferase [Marinobacter nanhaiticus]ENO14154.2 bifunctional cobalt-precorrin-7 (C(5))-methyltransferase/cobalt-precorrin-6B (C(15))-methyltransferase [Marinobacter nanhaiticus D15-8W]BES71538.1 bifunctional cobalt-precorrin-7 (C(5))-methyltransferase/cobalt-precorrin-6B (C(15))-methyltransferase [Marinobacter nanhaiticus D15-8W]